MVERLGIPGARHKDRPGSFLLAWRAHTSTKGLPGALSCSKPQEFRGTTAAGSVTAWLR